MNITLYRISHSNLLISVLHPRISTWINKICETINLQRSDNCTYCIYLGYQLIHNSLYKLQACKLTLAALVDPSCNQACIQVQKYDTVGYFSTISGSELKYWLMNWLRYESSHTGDIDAILRSQSAWALETRTSTRHTRMVSKFRLKLLVLILFAIVCLWFYRLLIWEKSKSTFMIFSSQAFKNRLSKFI